MRLVNRFALLPIFCLLLSAYLLLSNNPLKDIYHQYSVPTYITSSLSSTFHHGEPATYMPALPGSHGDKIIVMAKTSEDTSWVTRDLGDWQNAIYTVDASPSGQASTSGLLTTPANKGHEAMAYLTYIIDNYENLPATITFLHPHSSGFISAWHTDTALHSNVDALRTLNLTFVAQQGYVNLRCNWSPGCRVQDRDNPHVTAEIWSDVFERTSTPQGLQPYPGQVGQACCAQFAVTREQVRKRPGSDYERIRSGCWRRS